MTDNTVDIRSESLEPPSWLPSLEGYVRNVLVELQVTGWELSILVTNDDTMQTLNNSYRGVDSPTDVLSFQADDDPSMAGTTTYLDAEEHMPVGDIVIDLPYVERQAEEYGVSFDEELRRVIIHGVLHLAGHTHTTNDMEREPMLLRQENLLADIKETII